MKLYMAIIGCKPKGRFTEQHDIFFGIANSLKDLIPEMKLFWPEAKGNFHIDAWREVTVVDDHKIEIVAKSNCNPKKMKLFFINLGGYKENEFEEFHYKVMSVANSLSEATKKAKATLFYKQNGFSGAVSHIDDKYGIDVDDAYNVKDFLTLKIKQNFEVQITPESNLDEDKLHIGYLKLDKIL